jgi:hypothetical protein
MTTKLAIKYGPVREDRLLSSVSGTWAQKLCRSSRAYRHTLTWPLGPELPSIPSKYSTGSYWTNNHLYLVYWVMLSVNTATDRCEKSMPRVYIEPYTIDLWNHNSWPEWNLTYWTNSHLYLVYWVRLSVNTDKLDLKKSKPHAYIDPYRLKSKTADQNEFWLTGQIAIFIWYIRLG